MLKVDCWILIQNTLSMFRLPLLLLKSSITLKSMVLIFLCDFSKICDVWPVPLGSFIHSINQRASFPTCQRKRISYDKLKHGYVQNQFLL